MGVELAVELRRLEKEGRTGMLRAGDGAFHLAEGAIVSADCRRTTGLDRLVIEAGVASAEDWQRAGAGDPGSVLRRPRLEALALLSVFDAAYFMLASSAVPEFRPAPPHWLAPVCHIPPRALVHECRRRGDPESGPWPAELVDRTPVIPARRVRRQRVTLTGGQVEVLAAADARRSVARIARDLGRTTYGCLVAVRDLTAAGLIEPPAATPVPVMTAQPAMTGPVAIVPSVTQTASLPRRRVRQAAALPVPDRWEPVDRDVLVRLRAALEELA
ncbi:hypothetical protein [Nocardia sp. NPDC050710]|uniref:hypothetical protein n=1 Tax=Nocardia sp. NPDC050710 TaxID=3157220 RepID=UPI0033EBB173